MVKSFAAGALIGPLPLDVLARHDGPHAVLECLDPGPNLLVSVLKMYILAAIALIVTA